MSVQPADTEINGSKRTNRLKRRLDKDTTLEDLLEGWTQCCYLVPRKQKLCNVARSMHSLFCGNHQPAESVDRDADDNLVSNGANDSKKDKKERVPCPIDPTHTIFKSSLKYHIKVCTKLKQSNAMSEQAFFKQDCNSYSITCLPCEKSYITSEQTLLEVPVDADVLAAKINTVYAGIQAKCTNTEDIATFQDDNLSTTYAQAKISGSTNLTTGLSGEVNASNNPTVSSVAYSAAESDGVAAKIAVKLGQDLTSFSKMRHVDQDILLVQQMRDRGLINTGAGADFNLSPAVYVELGAGRGLLSYAVSCADPSATVVLVERYGSKKKIDKALKEDLAELKIGISAEESDAHNKSVATGTINRVRMDIRHCYLPLLPGVAATRDSTSVTDSTHAANKMQPVVVIAKHLCGVATDLAIQSVASFPHIPVTTSAATKQDHPAHKVGIAIATCCHHACHFPDYTGREWYLSQGFTEAEFEVLKKWSGWSTNTVNSSTASSVSATVTASATAVVADEEGSDRTSSDGNEESTNQNQHDVPLCPQVIRPANITSEQMQILGWKVKRVLDQGRVEYINTHYKMTAKQVRYCERRLSPECVLLVATQL